ncbi:hypothetical protein DPMN_183784 [Dreissena polymorpha]|uniref:Uncharacterized protein n=1 Tax=Dreissena polymorpha TaxID=45954 RepID=A0A9D4I6N5_DREPO|nr:hypothetical protein DPMN_183784 [Dreissena polymorpha]
MIPLYTPNGVVRAGSAHALQNCISVECFVHNLQMATKNCHDDCSVKKDFNSYISHQQRAAALLMQAADFLNVNTSDRSTEYQQLHLHQSQVTTNDHLLKELDETREGHQHRGESD